MYANVTDIHVIFCDRLPPLSNFFYKEGMFTGKGGNAFTYMKPYF